MDVDKQKDKQYFIMMEYFFEIFLVILFPHFIKSLYHIEKVHFIMANSIIKANFLEIMYFTKKDF